MKIQLVTLAPLTLNNGNRITALRWAAILKKLGHRVQVLQDYDCNPCDVLIALHARRSAHSIHCFHHAQPARPVIVVLTGTDVYRDIRVDRQAQQSLELATRIVVLQKMALQEVPKRFHRKTHVIYQSAMPLYRPQSNRHRLFRVCVVGHLRAEKDPLRAAFAVRRLPRTSRIQLTHVGIALEPRLEKTVRRESGRNPRYRWIGQLSHRRTRELLARSHLVCITSRMEGSSNVLSEALASNVPVVVSKIPGLIGTLGENFLGYFTVGDTRGLANLLLKAETDEKFYRALKRQCARFAPLVKSARETAAWRRLLKEVA
jgi:putative glycosyltransferase (TIGR04348 family)